MRTFLIILLGTLFAPPPPVRLVARPLFPATIPTNRDCRTTRFIVPYRIKKGFMWFGTDDGLNRFDGHQFRIYRYNSYEPESLPNDRIISPFEDSTGRIWVCTYSHTCYYDYQTDAFHP